MSTQLPQHDTVIYRLFPNITAMNELDSSLTQLAVHYTHILHDLIHDHIWHYDKFNLFINKETEETPPHLIGSTCYRENVDDEWFIVKLLLLLTERVNGLVISVKDEDGEFLLIETAHHLPKWLKPETADNRVYLYNGCLHIIPQPQTPAQVTSLPIATPTLREAVELVRRTDVQTEASPLIQKSLQSRLLSCCQYGLHCVHCYLPVPAAHILLYHRQLIASVVHTLCSRDKEDMKAANKLVHFSPKHHSMVLTDVMFTRTLYAMLCHDNFTPPRGMGFSLSSENSSEYKANMIGIKITCGLEMLVARYGTTGGGDGRRSLENDSKWSQYVSSLKDKGYFEGELEGSQRYQALLKTAEEYYINTRDSKESRSVLEDAGTMVNQLFLQGDWSEESLCKRTLEPPDDDSWLTMTPQQLDNLLSQRSGGTAQAGSLDLEDMAYGMRSFVDQVSSHDGAEFPWSANDDSQIQFDSEKFVETLDIMFKKLEGLNDTESLDTSSSEDEGPEEVGVVEVMRQMDEELSATTIGCSFQKADESEDKVGVAELEPVDVDFNLVQNLLESYSGQVGGAGPASNILQTLGVQLPNQQGGFQ